MKICTVEGCNRKVHARGFCKSHYVYKNRMKQFETKKLEYHNMTHTSIYVIWANIKYRCHNKNCHQYPGYGGRGISVCDKWRYSFKSFYADMGDKPFPKAQIDRIDNNGNYEPGNCRWVTSAQNIRNRGNIKLTPSKVKAIRAEYPRGNKTMKKIGQEYGVSRATIGDIINNKIWILDEV